MKRRATILTIGLGLLVAGLLMFQTPVLSTARGWAWDGWTRVLARVFRVGDIQLEGDVAAQLGALRAENVRLKAESADYRRLREQLGTPAFEDFRKVPAAVLARPIDAFRSQYVLNKGAKDDVVLGAPVVVQGSILLGFVSELSAETAIVQLVLHPGTSLTAEAVTEAGSDSVTARGLIKGLHYTTVVLTTVPRDAVLDKGMPVVTVARDDTVPFGLVIGEVEEIESQESEAYQRATLGLAYDPDSVDAVMILVPEKQ